MYGVPVSFLTPPPEISIVGGNGFKNPTAKLPSMTLKRKGNLDILKMYPHAENEAEMKT